jgi:hypothetical protein
MPRTRPPKASVCVRSSTRSGWDRASRLVAGRVESCRAIPAWQIAAYGIVLLWCLLSSGCCRVLGLAYRTTISEPAEYCTRCDKKASLELYSQWADQAWREQSDACATEIMQPDYASGFHDGFVDLVYSGGTGEPPPVPPRVFWNSGFRADGKQRANQWFDGYRHGARVAREGGYREMAIVQTSTAGEGYRHSEVDGRESSAGAAIESLASPEKIEALPQPAAPSQNDESVEPPITKNPFASPAELQVPPSGSVREDPQQTLPADEPVIALPSNVESNSNSNDDPQHPIKQIPTPPQTTPEQQSKPESTTVPEPVPLSLHATAPSSDAEPEVSVVNGTPKSAGDLNPSTPAASMGETEKHESSSGDNTATSTTKSPPVPATMRDPNVSTAPDSGDATESHLQTPRIRAASAVLFAH